MQENPADKGTDPAGNQAAGETREQKRKRWAKEDAAWKAPVDADTRFTYVIAQVEGDLKVYNPSIHLAGPGSAAYRVDASGEAERTRARKEDMRSCFFCADITPPWGEGGAKTVALPDDFYATTFLDLDPLNIPEFLAFQNQYGRVRGMREERLSFDDALDVPSAGLFDNEAMLRPAPSMEYFSGLGMFPDPQYEGILASQRAYDADPQSSPLTSEERIGAVSFLEAIAAARDAQEIIRDTTRILRDDLPRPSRLELEAAFASADSVSKHVSHTFPSLSLRIDGFDGSGKPITTVPVKADLISVVMAQLARSLVSNTAYRICQNPDCGKLFTPADHGRRADSRYCSPDCQEHAKHLRHKAKSKAEREKIAEKRQQDMKNENQ